jgi:hypothetical protein
MADTVSGYSWGLRAGQNQRSKSFLTVDDPSPDKTLLTIEEMRAAAGLATTDATKDASLTRLAAFSFAAIMAECNIATGTGGDPTLRQESLTQTVFNAYSQEIILLRRHNIEIFSVVADGADLVEEEDFWVDPESGLLTRIQSGSPVCWNCKKVVIEYLAGFEEIPGDLKQVASDFLRVQYNESTRDPSVKARDVEIYGVERKRTEYWAGAIPGQGGTSAVPDIASGALKRYRRLILI